MSKVKIIETNISYRGCGKEINNFQSRVIEVDDWESYVEEIRQHKTVNRNSYLGSMHGGSFPRYCSDVDVELFEADEYHLRFDYYNNNGTRITKLAYLIR